MKRMTYFLNGKDKTKEMRAGQNKRQTETVKYDTTYDKEQQKTEGRCSYTFRF
ncbi:hypothetical protein MsAg5_14780 [Methanosarcinaceae archaeon Ag5]|uniref:Uncharacterized protein n=1 Tax=Methanolapillus africanus TaxID=3028297 RepID=A0AAE4MM46_9EURY|nr:hypothetical protein [Methanosarcinaceae archaeon Ag5]